VRHSSETLGVDRVIDPPGALPQRADRIDGGPPLRPRELEIDVERLCLDSTSFRQISEAAGGKPEVIAASIEEVIADRGKMHNPVTGSGGVLVGTVRAVGEGYIDPPPVGQRIVTLASMTLTPLRVASVGPVDIRSPQVPASGTAYLMESAPWTELPEDLPLSAVLAALDVCGAPTHVRELSKPGETVLVLGAGHAGKLAMAAARDSVGSEGVVIGVDADGASCQRAEELGLCDQVLRTDLRDAMGTVEALRSAAVDGADLTVVVVNATGCEAASILATKDEGTVLFFSMATSFTAAALCSEGVSSRARMLIGSGFSPDRGAYALDLLRRYPKILGDLSPAEGGA